jgi:hypothetical protein
VLGAASAFWWGAPLRAEAPPQDGPEMAEVRSLWTWLKEHQSEIRGRVYLEDTFLAEPMNARLSGSHVLALTAHETGVRQLGAYYRLMPYATSLWTKSDQGTLFGRRPASAADVELVTRRMLLTHCTHLVLAEPRLASLFASRPGFRARFRTARFSVWELTGPPSDWAIPASDGVQVQTESYRSGEIELRTEVTGPSASVMVAESYHPFWKLSGGRGAELKPTKAGLISVETLPAGGGRMLLRYSAPRFPLWITIGGWLAIAALAIPRGGAR